MLKDYIRLILNESIRNLSNPDAIHAKTQSELSPSLINDKTDLSSEEVVQDLSDKFGKDYLISFVKPYKGQIPSVSVNPYSRFATPHGIYSYILTKKNLSDLFLKQNIEGDGYALNYPYFHVMMITSPKMPVSQWDKKSSRDKIKSAGYEKTVIINKDGSTSKFNEDVDEERKDDFSEVSHNLNYENYLDSVEKLVITQIRSQKIPRRKPDRSITLQNYNERLQNLRGRPKYAIWEIKKCYDALAHLFASNSKDEMNIEKNRRIEKKFYRDVAKSLDSYVYNYIRHGYSKRKLKNAILKKVSGYMFLKLWCIADILSYMTPNPKRGAGRANDSVRLTLMLKNAGIDNIVDMGFGLIHHKQPQQAASLHYGTDAPVKNLGTYNNIFAQLSKKELEELFIEYADYLH
tara:strand:+ start:1334 stop:2548 length:1215 start_codon:yes stop_codon:yes gene_type:complete